MARKQHTRGREYTENQKLKAENKALKKQVSRLKKLLARVDDPNRIQFLTELVDTQRREDVALHEKKKKIDVKAKWQCHECADGVIQLQIFNRADGVFYYRRCALCGNRTRMKKYHEGVEE